MDTAILYIFASVIGVSLLSFVGALALSLRDQVLRRLVGYLVAFTAGALLGDVFIHILPEVSEELGFTPLVSLLILLGIVSTFLVEKIIHWQHADLSRKGRRNLAHPVTFLTLFGDGIHNFIDGVTIAATYLINIPAGIATTIAVVLHEIPQEIGNFGVLVHGGFSKKKALFYNFLSALTAILGAVFVILLGLRLQQAGVYLSAYTAGAFIYIAGSDLVPELHREVSPRKSAIQLAVFILGMLVMWLLLSLE